MKRKKLLPILLAFTLIAGQAFQRKESIKRIALIVAIGDYKSGTGWGHLSSLADDSIVSFALEKQGFEDIQRLSQEKATIEGIRNSFRELEDKAAEGDVVYIHFSSHGQQIWDDNGDELDGYDEAIVTWDAPSKYFAGYTGDKHLRDDELGILVKKIRAKVGPGGDVIVCVDACHSGTALRGDITRGNKGAMEPPDFNPLNVKQTEDHGSVDGFTAAEGELSPVVLFSASRAHEPNQEHKGYGSLSLALTHSFDKLRQGDTYRSLFALITAEMGSMNLRQVPVMEGNVDRSLFGGNEVKQANYFPVKNIFTADASIDGGTLTGLYVGSKVAFMPAGSKEYDPDNAVYTATITSADINRAFVNHTGQLNAYKNNPKQLWVFVVEQSFGSYKIKVGAGESLSSKAKNELKKNVELLSFISWDEKNYDLYIEKDGKGYTMYLPDETPLFEPTTSMEYLNEQLTSFMQGKLMKEASFRDPDMLVELAFHPMRYLGRDEDNFPIFQDVDTTEKLVNYVWEINSDDVLFITLTNKGMKDAYVNILEIAPNGTVEVVLPDYENNESAFDYLLPAGQSKKVVNFARKPGPMKGQYTYKVFATEVPVSFRGMFITRGKNDPEQFTHPAAQLFQYSFRTRGENLSLKPTSKGGSTREYTVRLKP